MTDAIRCPLTHLPLLPVSEDEALALVRPWQPGPDAVELPHGLVCAAEPMELIHLGRLLAATDAGQPADQRWTVQCWAQAHDLPSLG